MTESIQDEERRRVRDAMKRATKAIQLRDGKATTVHIAAVTGHPVDTVRAYLQAKRRPRPEFVRVLAERAGIPVAELFAAIGWLPAHEVVPWDPLRVAEQVVSVSTTLERLVPHIRRALASLDTSAPAPVAAAQALLADDEGARRFTVLLSKLISPGRYATPTSVTAEFLLRPGIAPLRYADALRLAESAGMAWRPRPKQLADDPEYWSTSLELRARVHRALSDLDVGQYAWQGEPGTSTWADATREYPTHLLTQDPFGGAGWPTATNHWHPSRGDTLVVIGGRYTGSTAAAVVAEALGWQFVPLRSDVEVTAGGYVFPVRRDTSSGRVLAWDSAAKHIESRYRDGDPWRAVVLVGPSAFQDAENRVDEHALSLLRRTPARIVYARPPVEFLRWWARRQQGTLVDDKLDVDTWVAHRQQVRACIERELAERPRSRDLPLLIADPDTELPALQAAVPPEVVDAQARVAWSIIRWLDEVGAAGDGSLLERLRPGTLARWLPQLWAAREPVLPRLAVGDL